MSGGMYDVLVLGAGFAGSLTAMGLVARGRKTLVVDRAAHPRFVIGESTTPIANFVLAGLCRRYGLDEIAPLAQYGSARRLNEVVVGLKRGFSYFLHEPGRAFRPTAEHAHELLVAASHGPEDADTHWHRPSVDAWLARCAAARGAVVRERTEVVEAAPGPPWRIVLKQGERTETVRAEFVVDASGGGSGVASWLRLPDATERCRTWSSAVYAHVRGLPSWHERVTELGGATEEYPFRAEEAALHQLRADGGWMWVLPFDDGVTSIGFVDGKGLHEAERERTPAEAWAARCARYPTLGEWLEGVEVVAPEGGWRRTGRLQRRAGVTAGTNWALLPSAAYFIDPLHSTGIAHALWGIERLLGTLEEHQGRATLGEALRADAAVLEQEMDLVDRIVAGGYRSVGEFPKFAAFAMTYFAAATTCEARRMAGQSGGAFLLADDREFIGKVARLEAEMERMPAAEFEAFAAAELRAFNRAGLCDPARRNLYPYLVAPAGGRPIEAVASGRVEN